MSDPFDTLDDAIFAAAEKVRQVTGDKSEAITAIYELAGKFHIAEPAGSGRHSKADGKLMLPKGSTLLALMHNHPVDNHGLEGQDVFSPADMQQAKALGVPSFITYGQAMSIAQYRAGDPVSVASVPGGGSMRVSRGKPFDYIPEVQVTAKKSSLMGLL
jgi:hypothetical protein